MLDFQCRRQLILDAPAAPGKPSFLTAASGLVQSDDRLYVVADDELHLGIFAARGSAPGQLHRLFDGELPKDLEKRKRHKPDLEALTRLPPFAGHPQGALLALGSGSKRRRNRGSLLAIDAAGALTAQPSTIDCSALYAGLADVFEDLNIEGAAVHGNELILLQRGNKGASANAVIRYVLAPLLAALSTDASLPTVTPRAIEWHTLGTINGVPLCFTDVSVLAGGELVFTAVAEDTDNSYQDGRCAGAAVGLIDASGRLRHLETLSQPYKLEGLHAWRENGAIEVLAVTDADDPTVPASLLFARLTWV